MHTSDPPEPGFAEALAGERAARRRPAQAPPGSPPGRGHGRLWFAVVLTLLIAASVVTAVFSKPAQSPQRTLAGYASFEQVGSVQGTWSVPTILGGPFNAVAATWVGAQAPGSFGHAPFIQVGVQEASPGGDDSGYQAFWSDTQLDFHPVNLFLVNPGDLITASLRLGGGRWTVHIYDVTSGEDARFRTTDDTGASFNQAEWFQEDVTDNATQQGFPYPNLTPVRFRDLTVNSAQPTFSSLLASAMTVGSETLNPSPVRHNSFTVGER